MDTTDEDVELDNQRFQRWLERLQDSIKEMNTDADALGLADVVSQTIEKEGSTYPSWLSNATKSSIGRLASSPGEMQGHLRHIVLPHALQGYRRLRADLHTAGPLQHQENELADSSSSNQLMETNDDDGATEVASKITGETARGRWSDGTASQAIVLPPHTAPVSTSDGISKTILKKFFEGVRDGRTDGLVGLCNVADVHHRLTRALEHDSAQLTEWLTAEEGRRAENEQLIAHRERKLNLLKNSFLSDDGEGIAGSSSSDSCSSSAAAAATDGSGTTDMIVSEGPGSTITAVTAAGKPDLNSCMGKLQREVSVRSKLLEQAKEEEDRARRVYEEAVRARRAAAASLENVEEAVDTLKQRRELLLRVLSHRLEAEKYNATSATGRINLFRSLHGFLDKAREDFQNGRLAKELPKMFESLIGILESNITVPVEESPPGARSTSTAASASADESASVTPEPVVKMEVEGNEAPQQEEAEGEKKKENEDEQMKETDAADDKVSAAQAAADDAMAVAAARMKSYCSLRAGLEAVRVWRQLCGEKAHSGLRDKVAEFEVSLKEKLVMLPTPTPNDREAKSVFRRSDATIVLFYDDNKHATPAGHVESQARVKTCLKMIAAQLNDQAHSVVPTFTNNTDEGEPSLKRMAKRERRLHMLSCNDIISPPLWCLPLVHSPQYLAQLWALAQEAKDNDLYVPLEFDTEWESDEAPPSYDSDDDDPFPLFGAGAIVPEEKLGGAVTVVTTIRGAPGHRRRRQQVMLKRSLNLSSEVTQMLGADAVDSFSQLLEPEPGDDDVAETLLTFDAIEAKKIADEAEEAAQLQMRRRRSDEKESMGRNGKPFVDHRAAAADRVKTPFGDGMLINKDKTDPNSKIVQVQLAWGAIGYFNSSCVRPYFSRAIMRLLQGGRVLESSAGASSDYGAAPSRAAASARGQHKKRVFRQYKEEDIKQALRDAKEDVDGDRVSMVTPYPGKIEVRNTFLYACVKRMAAAMGSQSCVADMIGVTQGILSLWVNGRTSKHLSNSVQEKLVNNLKEYDDKGLLEAMVPAIDDDEEEESGDDENEDGEGSDKEDGDDDQEVGGEGKESKPRSSVARQQSRSGSRNSQPVSVGGPLARNTYRPLQRGKPVNDEKLLKLAVRCNESDRLRDIVKDVMAKESISQGYLATTLNVLYGTNYNQSGMSAWLYYRQKLPLCWETTRDCIRWLRTVGESTTASQKVDLVRVRAWYRRKSEEAGVDAKGLSDIEDDDVGQEAEAEDDGEETGDEKTSEAGDAGKGGKKSFKKTEDTSDDDIMSIDESEVKPSQGAPGDAVKGGEEQEGEEEGGDAQEPSPSSARKTTGGNNEDPYLVSNSKYRYSNAQRKYPTLTGDDPLLDDYLKQKSLLVTLYIPRLGEPNDNAKDPPAASATAVDAATTAAAAAAVPEEQGQSQGESKVRADDHADANEDDCGKPGDESVDANKSGGDGAAVPESNMIKKVIEIKLPQTIKELHAVVATEIRRRGLAQTRLAIEAGMHEHGFNQSNVSRFLKAAVITGTSRGHVFLRLLFDWVKSSLIQDRDLESFEEEEDEIVDDSITACPICGQKRSGFANFKGFQMHLGWCRRMQAKRRSELATIQIEQAVVEKAESTPRLSEKRQRDDGADDDVGDDSDGDEPSSKRAKVKLEPGTEGDAAAVEGGDDDQEATEDNSGEVDADGVPIKKATVKILSKPAPLPEDAAKRRSRNREFSVDALMEKFGGIAVPAETFKKGDHYPTCEVCHLRLNRHPLKRVVHETGDEGAAACCVASSSSASAPTGGDSDVGDTVVKMEVTAETQSFTAVSESEEKESEVPAVKQEPFPGSPSSVPSPSAVPAPSADPTPVTTDDPASATADAIAADAADSAASEAAADAVFTAALAVVAATGTPSSTSKKEPDLPFYTWETEDKDGLIRFDCATCPCVYHRDCLVDPSERTMRQPWYCYKCRESGADKAEVVTEEQKADPTFLIDKFVLLYANSLRRWRLGKVLHRTPEGHVLITWVRIDMRRGASNLLDISRTHLLLTEKAAESSLFVPKARTRPSRAKKFPPRPQRNPAEMRDIRFAALGGYYSESDAGSGDESKSGSPRARDDDEPESEAENDDDDDDDASADEVSGKRNRRANVRLSSPMAGSSRRGGRGGGRGRWGNRESTRSAAAADDAEESDNGASPASRPPSRGGGRGGGRWGTRRGSSGGNRGSRGGYLLMDGENDGSVTQRDSLASSGVGGVSGLRWADDEDDKPRRGGRGGGGGRWGRGGRGGRGGRRSAPSGQDDDSEAADDGTDAPGRGPDAPTTTVGMSDTYVSATSLQAALCAAGTACRAVDVVMCGDNTNAFACTRPPGHHAGRYGCTAGCLSTGFCLLNNAAIATVYARVRWGLSRVAVVDIDVHFGNGTAELLRGDPGAFFASIHMIYGNTNEGFTPENPDPKDSKDSAFERQLEKLAKIEKQERAEVEERDRFLQTEVAEAGEEKEENCTPRSEGPASHNTGAGSGGAGTAAPTSSAKKPAGANAMGFYPAHLGATEVTDTYVSVGVFPPLDESEKKRGRGWRGRGSGGASRPPSSSRGRGGRGRGRWWSRKRKEPVDEKKVKAGDEDNNEDADGEEGGDGNENENEVENAAVDEGDDDQDPEVDEDEDGDVEAAAEEAAKSDEMKCDEAQKEASSELPSQQSSSGASATKALPEFRGAEGFRLGLRDVIIPQMEKFKPELLIISAGFDGYSSDPLGGELSLSIEDYNWATQQLMEAMDRVAGGAGQGRVVSLLEGGYDTQPQTLGLARCVDAHVHTLRSGGL